MPGEVRTRRVGERLPFDIPPADAPIELTVGMLTRRGTAARVLKGLLEHSRVARAVPLRSGLDQRDARTGLRQNIGGHSAAGAGANDTYVVFVFTHNLTCISY